MDTLHTRGGADHHAPVLLLRDDLDYGMVAAPSFMFLTSRKIMVPRSSSSGGDVDDYFTASINNHHLRECMLLNK
jgi:hypothetical protein